jgi:hypothetical protein
MSVGPVRPKRGHPREEAESWKSHNKFGQRVKNRKAFVFRRTPLRFHEKCAVFLYSSKQRVSFLLEKLFAVLNRPRRFLTSRSCPVGGRCAESVMREFLPTPESGISARAADRVPFGQLPEALPRNALRLCQGLLRVTPG